MVDYAEQANLQEHEQFSEELRLHFVSPDARFEFLGGLYYQSEELSIEESFHFNLSNLIDAGVALFPLNSTIITFYDQDTESFAAFGEGSYEILDRLTLSVGLRYTHDEKEVDKELLVAALGNADAGPWARAPGPHYRPRSPRLHPGADRHRSVSVGGASIRGERGFHALRHLFRGLQGGRVRCQNVGGALDLAAFEPEEAKAYEIGGKFTFGGGAAKLNIAYFHNEYVDLQVAAWNGLVFTVQNAASATSQGVELDGQWQVTDNFVLGGALAWLDAEYDRFLNATCTAPQQTAFAAATGMPPGRCVQTCPAPTCNSRRSSPAM